MTDEKAKTMDGDRTAVSALNIGGAKPLATEVGLMSRMALIYRRLNEVMAGMYTGVACSGTPNTHHRYDQHKATKKTYPATPKNRTD